MKLEPLLATRHALVWLGAGAVWRARALDRPRLREWLGHGWPLVLARPQGEEPAGWLRLGASLPPAEDKRRLTLLAPPQGIDRWRPPLALSEIFSVAPSAWRGALRALTKRVRAAGLPEPGVFGGFAWQALTGLPHVGPTSDLDLVWRVSDQAGAAALFALLHGWEQATGRRADGELLLPGAAAVAWRELAGGALQVLVKTPTGVRLRSRAGVFAALAVRVRERAA